MGFFDKLINGAAEVIDGTKKAFENIQRDMEQENSQTEFREDVDLDNPSEPLPGIPVQTKLHGNNVKIMISEDFTDHNGYANSTFSLKYNPKHLGVLDMDDENEITISLQEGIGDFDDIAECIDEYISTGTVSDIEQFEEINDGKYLFKAKMESSDYVLNYYVLQSDASDPYDFDILLLLYPTRVLNTNLEKKLTDCFDEAAKSLSIEL